ncbi:MAG: glycosyltransferase family 25 protein [Alphaproteobacteria bacterium]|nr:glycosyltransferase family 25 protein [Alphaproteobacteria bacterium]
MSKIYFSEFFCATFPSYANTLFLTFLLLIAPISLCETPSDTVEKLYDKIYVISLDRTPERYAYVKKQLDKFNLKHERFSAVDGKLITVTDTEENRTIPWAAMYHRGYRYGAILKITQKQRYKDAEFLYKHDRYTSNLGEFGCAMSHRAVWADVVKNNYKRVIVFEDDITLEDDFSQKLSLIMNNLPNDFDVFFLDIGAFLPKLNKSRFLPPNFWLNKFSNTLSPYYAKVKPNNTNLWGSHGYVVTCDSSKKLLEKTKFMNIPIDNSIIFSGLKLYISKIKLLSGTKENSVIRGSDN